MRGVPREGLGGIELQHNAYGPTRTSPRCQHLIFFLWMIDFKYMPQMIAQNDRYPRRSRRCPGGGTHIRPVVNPATPARLPWSAKNLNGRATTNCPTVPFQIRILTSNPNYLRYVRHSFVDSSEPHYSGAFASQLQHYYPVHRLPPPLEAGARSPERRARLGWISLLPGGRHVTFFENIQSGMALVLPLPSWTLAWVRRCRQDSISNLFPTCSFFHPPY